MEPRSPVGRLQARRPLGLLVLIGLLTLKAALLATALIGDQLPEVGPIRRIVAVPGVIAQALRDTPMATAMILVLVALLVVAAIGLWSRRRWGWVIAMIVTGLFIAVDIWAFSDGRANHLWMLLNAITVLYLNQTDVRQTLVGRALDDRRTGAPR